MKKTKAINFIKVLIAVIVTISMVSVCAWVLHSKGSYRKMHEFYKYPNDYEVWFFGSSHTIMSTLPEEMYNEYGIRSYNLANYGQTFALDYWIARTLLTVSKPKLIVLDVSGSIGSNNKYSEENLSSVRKMITSLPIGIEKYRAIMDLFEGDLREEMLFPFSSDHYNWEYLKKENFILKESFELGSDQNVFGGRGSKDYVLVTPKTIPDAISIENTRMTESVNRDYFRKMIEMCRDNDIEILLVKCPLHTKTETMQLYNQAFLIGQEYGIPYLNGFELKGVFDGDTDLWDASHLNSLGARKWTHILGQYICKHYPQLEKTTNGIMKVRWDSRYDKYLEWLDTELPLQTHFYSFLMLCTNPKYTMNIQIRNDSPVLNDSIAMKLIDLSSANVIYFDGDKSSFDIGISVQNTDGDQVDNAYFALETDNTYKRLDGESTN